MSFCFLPIESRKGFQCLRNGFGSIRSGKRERENGTFSGEFHRKFNLDKAREFHDSWDYSPHHRVVEFLNLFLCSSHISPAILLRQCFNSVGEKQGHLILRHNVL